METMEQDLQGGDATERKNLTLKAFDETRVRLARLLRLIELGAPQFMIDNEYHWFQTEVRRADQRVRGIELTPYTQKQQAELDMLAEIERLDDD